MNIFVIITDSICNYERNDIHSILPTYKKLIDNNEGFFFENAISPSTSTLTSITAIITGKFTINVMPDFLGSLKGFFSDNYINELKRNDYNIHSILSFQIGAHFLGNVLNPTIIKEMAEGKRELESSEVYELFKKQIKDADLSQNNFFYVHFRAGDSTVDKYFNKIIQKLKEEELWDNSIIVATADHGYYNQRFYKTIKLMHVDDIKQSTIETATFMKLPKELSTAPHRTIKQRIILIDIFETIFDYLQIDYLYEKNAISFRGILENDEKENNRIIRSDAYYIFQPVQMTAILKNNFKLLIENEKIRLIDIKNDKKEKHDLRKKYKEKYKELYDFYLKTNQEAIKNADIFLEYLFENSILQKLNNENIFIPKKQFHPYVVKFLRNKLKINNNIIEDDVVDKDSIVIILYNRIIGYGVKQYYNKYKHKTKRIMILNPTLQEITQLDLKKTSYIVFLYYYFLLKYKNIIQRPRTLIVQAFYFPLYINRHIKKYYK